MLYSKYLIGFTLFFFCNFNYIKSQNYEVIGKVLDSTSHIEMPFCNVLIYDEKDSIIAGTITNEKGNFAINELQIKGTGYLIFKYFGYNDKKHVFQLSQNKKLNIGLIYLKQKSINLNEVIIEGINKPVEFKFDRKVYTISDAKVASANTILDLLRTITGVIVDENGTIKYKGSIATIYIDNQSTELTYPNPEMIPIANIDKIEVIDAASRSGSGKGGIINIKMKKIKNDGLSGWFSSRAATADFLKINSSRIYTNLNYKYKKVIFFSTFNHRYTQSNTTTSTKGIFDYINENFQINKYSQTKSFSNNPMLISGIFFHPNEKSKLYIVGHFSNSLDNDENFFTHIQYLIPPKIYDNYGINKKDKSSNIKKAIGTSFTTNLDTLGKELTITTYVQDYTFKFNQSNNYQFNYINSFYIDSLNNITIDNIFNRKDVFLDVYYNHPFSKVLRWNSGLNIFLSNNQKDKLDILIDNKENIPQKKSSIISNQEFIFNNRLGGTIKKWKIDAGISIQNNYTQGNFTRYNLFNQDTIYKVDKTYLNFLPSFTISYTINDLEEIKLTFDRSLNAPWVGYFCEFIEKHNPRNWVMGNKNLQPVDYNNIYLGYNLSKDKWNYSVDVFYSVTNNEISEVIFPYSELVSITIPENIASKQNIGLDMATWISANKKIELNLSSSFFHTILDAAALKDKMNSLGLPADNLIKRDLGYYIKFSNDIRFNSTTSGMLYVNYFGKEITFEGYKRDFINSSLSLTKRFFDRKFNVSLGLNNIFDDLFQHGYNYNYAGYDQSIIENGTNFYIKYFVNLQYTFRQGDRGTRNVEIK